MAALASDLDPNTPIGRCLIIWQEVVGGDHGALDRVLADDAVLHSPVLFKPLPGKEIVTKYLTAAAMTFVGDHGEFRYVREVLGERDAVLEFETTMNGKYVNGVDVIRCDDDGKIVDFKVMVRPLQAMDAVRQMMMAALETLG